MKEKKVYRLKPDEYIVDSSITGDVSPEWRIDNGLLITKGDEKIPVYTFYAVDPDCEIEVTIYKNNFGRVKYIKSTPRRRYYKGLLYASILLTVVSLILLLYELEVNGNYAVEGSPSYYLLMPFLTSWYLSLVFILRNAKGFTKTVLSIFGYIFYALSVCYFLTYIVTIFTRLG